MELDNTLESCVSLGAAARVSVGGENQPIGVTNETSLQNRSLSTFSLKRACYGRKGTNTWKECT